MFEGIEYKEIRVCIDGNCSDCQLCRMHTVITEVNAELQKYASGDNDAATDLLLMRQDIMRAASDLVLANEETVWVDEDETMLERLAKIAGFTLRSQTLPDVLVTEDSVLEDEGADDLTGMAYTETPVIDYIREVIEDEAAVELAEMQKELDIVTAQRDATARELELAYAQVGFEETNDLGTPKF